MSGGSRQGCTQNKSAGLWPALRTIENRKIEIT